MNNTKKSLQSISGVLEILVGIFISIIGVILMIVRDAVSMIGMNEAKAVQSTLTFVGLIIIAFGIAMIVLGSNLARHLYRDRKGCFDDRLGVSITIIVINGLFLLTAIGTGFIALIHLIPLLIALLAGIALFLKHPDNSPQAIKARKEAEHAAASVFPTSTRYTAMPSASKYDELMKWKQLLDAGVLTQEEFDAKKRQLL